MIIFIVIISLSHKAPFENREWVSASESTSLSLITSSTWAANGIERIELQIVIHVHRIGPSRLIPQQEIWAVPPTRIRRLMARPGVPPSVLVTPPCFLIQYLRSARIDLHTVTVHLHCLLLSAARRFSIVVSETRYYCHKILFLVVTQFNVLWCLY